MQFDMERHYVGMLYVCVALYDLCLGLADVTLHQGWDTDKNTVKPLKKTWLDFDSVHLSWVYHYRLRRPGVHPKHNLGWSTAPCSYIKKISTKQPQRGAKVVWDFYLCILDNFFFLLVLLAFSSSQVHLKLGENGGEKHEMLSSNTTQKPDTKDICVCVCV